MAGFLGFDFDATQPAQLTFLSAGAGWIRDLTLKIKNFFGVLFNLETGALNPGTITSSALTTPPTLRPGTYNRVSTDRYGIVLFADKATSVNDYGGLVGVLSTGSPPTATTRGGTGLNAGPAGPNRFLYVRPTTGITDWLQLTPGPSINFTFDETLLSKTPLPRTIAGAPVAGTTNYGQGGQLRADVVGSSGRSVLKSVTRTFPFNGGGNAITLPDVNPINGAYRAWKIFLSSDAGPTPGVSPKFVVYDYWFKIITPSPATTTFTGTPLELIFYLNTQTAFQRSTSVSVPVIIPFGVLSATSPLLNVYMDDTYGPMWTTDNFVPTTTGPLVLPSYSQNAGVPFPGNEPCGRYGAWACPPTLVQTPYWIVGSGPGGQTPNPAFSYGDTSLAPGLPYGGYLIPQNPAIPLSASVAGVSLEVGLRYIVS